MLFDDREEAGKKLAEAIERRGIKPDLVLSIPRGGLPIGREVADTLDVPLDIVVARKIGSPQNPELAIGAVSSDGTCWLNEDVIEREKIDDDFIQESIEKETKNAKQKMKNIRKGQKYPVIEGKKILVVDDGIATGSTMIACLNHLRNLEAESITVAVPVGPKDIKDTLQNEADNVIILETPEYFGSVGSHYKDFTQVKEFEARNILN